MPHKHHKENKETQEVRLSDATAAIDHASEVTEPAYGAGHTLPVPNYLRYRVDPGKQIKLSDINPDETGQYQAKADAKEELGRQRDHIRELQARLYAEHQQSLLIVLQAMDTGGKDGTIRHVFKGMNQEGCRVWSFKVPTSEELDHDFLWRYHKKMPSQRMITIFNRSQYEDVLVVRVKNLVPESVWQERYTTINEFEQALTLNNTTILKFYLHISKDEQKRRLEKRLENPRKCWKFSIIDVKERAYWDQYMEAYEDAINKCSTDYAPWYVIPANKKWYRNLVVARIVADTLEAMNPQYPESEEELDKIKIPD